MRSRTSSVSISHRVVCVVATQGVAAMGGVDISWIIGLVVPAVLYYVAARKWHSAVPDRLILPVEQDAVDAQPSRAGRIQAV